MNKDFHYLGWNPVEIRIGLSLFNFEQPGIIKPGFHIGDIRNCSYAPSPQYIGVAAEDRSHGGQVVAVHDRLKATNNVLIRRDFILYHTLNSKGTKLCYTMPSDHGRTAELYLFHLQEEESWLLIGGVVAQNSPLSWFPDDKRIAYHTDEGNIETLDIATGQREVLETGWAPSVDPSGEQIAFHRDNNLLIWSKQGNQTRPVQLKEQLIRHKLVNGFSWSPDGAYLSFGRVAGVVGKETNFYLLEIASGISRKIKLDHLSGLLLLRESDNDH